MKIEKLELKNVGQFQSLTLDFAPLPAVPSNVTIFIGNNGAGKTSILKSLATVLSWFVARIRSDKGNGTPIAEDVIRNDAVSAAIQLRLHDQWGQLTGRWPRLDPAAGESIYPGWMTQTGSQTNTVMPCQTRR
jgi:DNA repair exonuclease SbcCD ATPase subunit